MWFTDEILTPSLVSLLAINMRQTLLGDHLLLYADDPRRQVRPFRMDVRVQSGVWPEKNRKICISIGTILLPLQTPEAMGKVMRNYDLSKLSSGSTLEV